MCVCTVSKRCQIFSTQRPVSMSFTIMFYKRKKFESFFLPSCTITFVPFTKIAASCHLIYKYTDRKKNIQLFSYLEILSKIFTCCTQVNMNIININYFDEFSDNTLTAVTGTAAVMIN